VLTLYTPGTGFPDLEAKIAFGLARVAVEAGTDVTLQPLAGLYRVDVQSDAQAFNEAFRLLAQRMLTALRVYFVPGIQPKYRKNFPPLKNGQLAEWIEGTDITSMFNAPDEQQKETTNLAMCGHDLNQVPPFGGKTGLMLFASSHAGMPSERDRRSKDYNTKLCSACGLLTVLALHTCCFHWTLGTGGNRHSTTATLLPQIPMDTVTLSHLLAAQKLLSGGWLSDVLPLRVVPLAVAAKFPHVNEVARLCGGVFHLVMFDSGNRDRVEGTIIHAMDPLARFLRDSPHNCATVQLLLRGAPKVAPLTTLNEAIGLSGTEAARPQAMKFARLFAQEAAPKDATYPRLLYYQTARYLMEVMCMIDPRIIEHEAVNAVAGTLRYFVNARNYSYVDSLRNAREGTTEFEDTLAKMLREARVRGEEENVWIPADQHIKEVIELAGEDFEATKTALVLLSLTWHRATAREQTTTTIEPEVSE